MAQWHCLWLVRRCLLPTLLTTLLLVNLTLLLPRTRITTPQPISMGKNASMKYSSPPPQPPLANKSQPSPQPPVHPSLATKPPPPPPPPQSSLATKPSPPPPPQSSLATKPPTPSPSPPSLQTAKWDPEDFYQTKRRIAERVARLREKCSKIDKPSKVKAKTLDISLASRIQVLEEHRLMACQVQKAGSTAWNTLLAFRYNNTKILKNKKDYYKMLLYLNPSVKRFKEVATSKDFRRFFIVRDPLERLLSAYRDKFWDQSTVSWQANYYVPLILRYSRGQSYTHQEIYFINGSIRIVPTFTEFVRFVVDQPFEDFDTHWKPISLYCGVCYINYTDIVHMETFLPDMNYIMRVSGLDHAVDPGLLTYNTHKGRANTQDLLFSYYSELGTQLLLRVVDVYKQDYSLFGYDPTDFLAKVSPNVTIKWRV